MTIPHDVDPSVVGRLTCGTLRLEDVGREVTLRGWVNRRRDLGGLIFIDLRDRYGLTQVVFNPEIALEAHEAASDVRGEYVLEVQGIVRERPEGTRNPKLAHGMTSKSRRTESKSSARRRRRHSRSPRLPRSTNRSGFAIATSISGARTCKPTWCSGTRSSARCVSTSPTAVSSRSRRRC